MMERLIRVMRVLSMKDVHAWSGVSPEQLSMIDFWNLIFVWLKGQSQNPNHVTSN